MVTKPPSSSNGARAPASRSGAGPTSATMPGTGWFHSSGETTEFLSVNSIAKRTALRSIREKEQQEGHDGTRQSESRGRTGTPGTTLGGSRADLRQRTASAQPGRFEGVGPHS